MAFSKLQKGASTGAAFLGMVLVKMMGFGAGYGAVHALNTYHTPTRQEYHDAMVDGIRKVHMPMKIDDITTLVAERVDDLQMVYTYEVSGDKVFSDRDWASLKDDLTHDDCTNDTMKQALKYGATMRYEYNRKGQLLAALEVNSCPVEASTAVPPGLVGVGPLQYSYEVQGDYLILHASGDISYQEAEAFNKFRETWRNLPLGHTKDPHIALSLDSGGGSISGANDMATWVRENKVETIVPNGAKCASACVLVWGAGVKKWAGVTSQIGVHNAVDPSKENGEAAEGTVFMAKALSKEGAPPAIVGLLTTTESKDIHWLNEADLRSWNAILYGQDGKSL